MNQSNLAPKTLPQAQPAVHEAADRVSLNLSDIETLIRTLESRLDCVLTPPLKDEADAAGLPPAHPVPLAQKLHFIADRARDASLKLEDILNRLSV